MIRKLFRFLIRSAIVAGVVAIALRLLRGGQGASPARRGPTGTRRPTSPSSSPAPASETAPSDASSRQSIETVAPQAPAPSPNAAETMDPPAPAEAPARPSAPEGAAWVAPDFDGNCPDTHPVKAKQSSGIYHVPGGLSYDRTTPDRCYRDVTSAEADGYRPSKR